MQKSTIAKNEVMKANRKWFVIDATDQVLGDLAVKAANILRGKEKNIYTPSVDCGDFLIIKNVSKVKVTGNKLEDKKYYRHSGYFGHLKTINLKDRMIKDPEGVMLDAVSGMLPKTRLGKAEIKKLFIYKDEGKDHSAQTPEEIKL
ncbi:MAG: 50S ribosomal protein L13 [Mycoplasmataceae bacterium]|nr:50S ribosomal protein L13 [Mycoplasmataceae bacterium]